MSKKKPSAKTARLRRDNTVLAVLCAAAVLLIPLLLLLPGKTGTTVTYGQFTPPPFDSAAVRGEPEVPEELGWSEMQIRAGFTAFVCGALCEEGGQVPVWLYNHPDSDCWLKLRVTDTEGNVLGETGLLRPGEHVQYLTLDTVPSRNTTVVLRLMGYEPDTYYSAGSVGLETTLNVAG